jgi:hypothetical protein
LKYAGTDVTSDLRSLANAAVLLVKSQLTAQKQVPEFAAATPTLLSAVDRYAAALNKLAADIAASGTASLPMVPPTGSALSATVTVTRKQLETFFALYYSMTGAPPGALPPTPAGFLPRTAPRDASSATGPCLTDNAAYKSCLDVVGTDPFEPFQAIFLELIQHSSLGNCTFDGLNATIAIIDSYLARLFHFPLFNCYTQPTEIESFKAQPAPDPIPVGTRNGGTLITARLQSLFTAGSFAVAPLGEALLALDTLPSTCQSQIKNSVIQVFQTINTEAIQIVKDLVNSGDWKIAPSVDVPVYKCDIDDLLPDDPSRIGRRPDWDNDPALRFGLEGFKAGPAPLKVLPKAQHFMRLDDWDTKRAYRTRYLEQDPELFKIVQMSVNVAGGKKLVVNGSLQNIGPFLPSAAISPNQVVVPGEDFSVPLATGNFGGGPAYESHSVTQVNDTTWQIQIAQGGNSQGRASISFSNPQNRNNTQHVIIQANAAGMDCGMYFTASARGPNGNLIGPSYNVLHVDPQSYTIDAPGAVTGAVLLEIDGVTGGSCVANATIQLLDQ